MSTNHTPKIGQLIPVIALAVALAATTIVATATAEKGAGTTMHVVTAADREMAAKNAPEPKREERGEAQLLAGGGPDGFGYVWADSNEPGGPVYSWVDITATGTALGLSDDGEANVSTSFGFPFYGGVYTDLRVGNNGGILVGVTAGNIVTTNACPLPGQTEPAIFPFWDDIDSDTGDVYWEDQVACAHPDCAGGCLVVEWFDRPHFSNIGAATFEAILCDDGDIIFQYADVDFGNPTYNGGASATVGIEDDGQDASYFLEATCNSPVITDTMAIRFNRLPGAGIQFNKTVGTDPNSCATTDSIVVASGTDVTYCYEVSNVGTITLSLHDLVDSELGTILSNFSYALAPMASVFLTAAANIVDTTVNTATWTAYNPGPSDVITAADTATVIVAAAEPLACNGPLVEFFAGIPPDWTVINNAVDNPVEWAGVAASGEAGNWATGNGDAASASSDLQGGGSGLYDTELWSSPFDLPAGSAVTLEYWVNYQNFAAGDFLDVDISTDGGSGWTNLLSWNEDHGSLRSAPGEFVTLDLSAYAGQTGLILRWHYYDPAGPATSQDWYAQVDEVGLLCTQPPEITVTKTVGLDPNVCSPSDNISVAAGTDVTYCYWMDNTGPITVSVHDVVDSELGILISGLPVPIGPGGAAWFTATTPIAATVVNTVTWTAGIPGGPSAVATDTALVVVNTNEPLVCLGNTVLFEGGPPLDWNVVDNEGSGVVWITTGSGGYPGNCGEGNYTDGTGFAACASSDVFGAAPYDTELWSPPFDTTGMLIVQLNFNANFQNFAANDFLDVDVSTNGGSAWTNVMSWNEDHGGFRAPPGEAVSLDISAVAANQPSVIVRWRWYDPNAGNDYNWYAEIDDASLFCDIPVELQSLSVE